jgi:hypothetical protein
MDGKRTHRRGGSRIPTSIDRADTDSVFNHRRDKSPAAHIAGFILHPDNPGRRSDRGVKFLKRRGIERIELLDTQDSCGGILSCDPLGIEFVEDLTGTE